MGGGPTESSLKLSSLYLRSIVQLGLASSLDVSVSGGDGGGEGGALDVSVSGGDGGGEGGALVTLRNDSPHPFLVSSRLVLCTSHVFRLSPPVLSSSRA